MEVQSQTFVLDGNALPSLDDVLQASDPDKLGQLYRDAGLELLANNVEPLRRLATARRQYVELSSADYETYAGYLSHINALETCDIPPPESLLPVFIGVRKSELFSAFFVLSHPETGESLFVGEVHSDKGVYHFKIAQWGFNLTSIEEMRKVQQQRNAQQQRKPLLPRPKTRSAAYFGLVTVAAAVPSWLFLRPVHWGLFMGVQVAAMILCYCYVASKTLSDSVQRFTVGCLIAVNLIASFIAGAVQAWQANHTDRTEEVLVCGAEKPFAEQWMVTTNKGDLMFDPGFYNGTYYSEGNEALAKSLVGKWVRVTVHGQTGWSGPYITEATTLRDGSCAK